ncbi:MAG: catalase [Lachnospiraceae bacterium]|nr:catalase [Lachnospiraceae bacterium]
MAHRRMVLKHCIKAGIPLQGLVHDLSKYSPSEFYYGVKFFKGDRSPNEGEREDHGYSYAWMHHKGRNKHHFEYWNDYNIEANKALPVKMPLKYVIEMFCDRVAASKIYLKDNYTNLSPYEYFDKGRSRRTIHQETSDFLEKLLRMLAKKGENYTFLYIKWYMKHHDTY